MSHHYYCWVCGDHVSYFESYPYRFGDGGNVFGGYGDGICTDCSSGFFDGDDKDSFRAWKIDKKARINYPKNTIPECF